MSHQQMRMSVQERENAFLLMVVLVMMVTWVQIVKVCLVMDSCQPTQMFVQRTENVQDQILVLVMRVSRD